MIPKYPKDLLWAKEITAVIFVMLLCLLFFRDFSSEHIWFGLILLGAILHRFSTYEERKYGLKTRNYTYFCNTSSYFLVGTFFFTMGYVIFKVGWGWEGLFASLGVILFAIGIARVLFSEAMRPFHLELQNRF